MDLKITLRPIDESVLAEIRPMVDEDTGDWPDPAEKSATDLETKFSGVENTGDSSSSEDPERNSCDWSTPPKSTLESVEDCEELIGKITGG